jgi:hypothetical protein
MSYMSRHEATQKIASLLEVMQELHAQARAISDEYEIPFEITLDGGANYDVTAEYTQWKASSSWDSSSC